MCSLLGCVSGVSGISVIKGVLRYLIRDGDVADHAQRLVWDAEIHVLAGHIEGVGIAAAVDCATQPMSSIKAAPSAANPQAPGDAEMRAAAGDASLISLDRLRKSVRLGKCARSGRLPCVLLRLDQVVLASSGAPPVSVSLPHRVRRSIQHATHAHVSL
jgi:hypothetical protein